MDDSIITTMCLLLKHSALTGPISSASSLIPQKDERTEPNIPENRIHSSEIGF
jgi:hypothetical protein